MFVVVIIISCEFHRNPFGVLAKRNITYYIWHGRKPRQIENGTDKRRGRSHDGQGKKIMLPVQHGPGPNKRLKHKSSVSLKGGTKGAEYSERRRGVGCGEGVSPSPLVVGSGEGVVPSPLQKIWTFYLEIALFGAF